ncbi:HAMP domain-containing histidine kinase [Myxococcota bacterium]|nr:HAMP domain-containing histidine kinase [Myxococcota bacterium]
MRGPIRWQITLWAFAVFLTLAGLESSLVLGGMERALYRLADDDLTEKLDELASELADASLMDLTGEQKTSLPAWSDLAFEIRDYLDSETDRSSHTTQFLYEIQREGGQILARSASLEDQNFPTKNLQAKVESVSFREESDPRPGRDTERLRIATVNLGPYRLQLARGLTPFLETYAAIRAQILAFLTGIPLLAALGTYLIATRALSPVRRLVDEAQRLRTLSEGTLPRTGSGDEIDDLARVLNALLVRVREDVLRMRQFTADAAHELRTPLATIRGHVELLMERVDASSQQSLSVVLSEIERLARLVSQLLLLEKLEANPESTLRDRVNLGDLARDLVDHLSLMANDQGIRLVAEIEPVFVVGDSEKLRQVFLNLLDNAFKHTPTSGSVGLKVFQDTGTAKVVILDEGPGIAAERLERVFERFATDRSSRTAGTGLGLSIARAIARAHGGDVRAASPGGAEFTLELPIAA